jgi:hypothetical protein
MELHQTTLSLVNQLKESLIIANKKENKRDKMTNFDDSESDDLGRLSNSPLSLKSALKTDDGGSNTTLSTSPLSSCSSSKSYNLDADHSITFNDNLCFREIDCEYTQEQTRELWFTKTEYDHFLQACDEDAQKSEAHEKELRVAKLKKEIRKQRRQRRKEEKRLQQMNTKYGVNSNTDIMDLEMDDDIIDDGLDEAEPQDPKEKYNEDEEGWLCNLGLEAWTLEGYTTREHNRQKAIDAVLNEQYAAWDRGMVENAEMMSALYFAASATSKHTASKKAKELEDDTRDYTLLSTLEAYNKAVQTMNVLQKTLFCIKSKNTKNGGKKANRRGSNESTASDMIDRALGITVESDLPTLPLTGGSTEKTATTESSTQTHPPPTSSSSARKKYIRKNAGKSRNVYKSKASTSIIVAPPTPPVVKARRVKRLSIGGPPLAKSNATAINMSGTTTTTRSKSPKSKKIVYQPPSEPTLSKDDGAKTIKSKKTITSKDEKKKKKKMERRRSMGDVPSTKVKGDTTKSSKGDKHSKAKRRNSNTYDKESASVASKLLKKMAPANSTKKSSSKASKKNAPAVESEKKNKKEHWWFQQQMEAAQ